MNYDNQRLMFIQQYKHSIKQQIDSTTDEKELKELKQSLRILREDEKQILESMDYLR